VPHKFMGRRDGPARFHGVPVRFEERQEPLPPLMFGRIALQRDPQPPYAYGSSSPLYYKHILKPICDETVLNGEPTLHPGFPELVDAARSFLGDRGVDAGLGGLGGWAGTPRLTRTRRA